MILDILTGRYGPVRQWILLGLIGLSLLGFAVMISSLYYYFQLGEYHAYVTGALWANGIFFISQLAVFFMNLRRRPRVEGSAEPARERGWELYEDYEHASTGPKGFDQSDRQWDNENIPLPLDKILFRLDFWTYDRLDQQKKKYRAIKNDRAANVIKNLMKPWERHKHWREHSGKLRHVRLIDLKKWSPKNPSPTPTPKPQNAVPR